MNEIIFWQKYLHGKVAEMEVSFFWRSLTVKSSEMNNLMAPK